MKTEASYWDTSAIVPVCCVQQFTARARQAYRRFKKPIIWWGTPVEMQCALRRLNRTGLLTGNQTRGALRLWGNFRIKAQSVVLYEKTTALAEHLPEEYGLRSLDAFQLAAALVWCKEKPRNRPFICADLRLGGAASGAGFDVIDVL